MPDGGEGESPRSALTPQQTKPEQIQPQQESAASNPRTEQEKFNQGFWEQFIETASRVPLGEDPAFWPVRMFNEFEYLILNREYIKNKQKAAFVEQLAPIQETISKVRTAYEILAYPHVKYEPWREEIEHQLDGNRLIDEKEQVELNDVELGIVHALCETPRYSLYRDTETIEPKIPFDPQKRIYKHSEVFNSSHEIAKPLDAVESIASHAHEALARGTDNKK